MTIQPRLTTVLAYRRHYAITGKHAFFNLLFLIRFHHDAQAQRRWRQRPSQSQSSPMMTTTTGATFSHSVLTSTRYHWQVSIFFFKCRQQHLHGGTTSWLWAGGTGHLGAQALRGRGHSCSGGTDRLHACKTSHSHTQGTDCVRARGSRGESHLHIEEACHLHGWKGITSQ